MEAKRFTINSAEPARSRAYIHTHPSVTFHLSPLSKAALNHVCDPLTLRDNEEPIHMAAAKTTRMEGSLSYCSSLLLLLHKQQVNEIKLNLRDFKMSEVHFGHEYPEMKRGDPKSSGNCLLTYG